MKKIRLALLLFCLAFVWAVRAQMFDITSYGMQSGLNSNYIFSLEIDSRGLLWIGTDRGASVFNGTEFCAIKDTINQCPYIVYRISETRPGRIWLCTFERGALLVDIVENKIIDSVMPSNTESVFDILEDGFGRTFLRTPTGIEIKDGLHTVIICDSLNTTPNNWILKGGPDVYYCRLRNRIYQLTSTHEMVDVVDIQFDSTTESRFSETRNLYFTGDSLPQGKGIVMTKTGLWNIQLQNGVVNMFDFQSQEGSTSFRLFDNGHVIGTINNGIVFKNGENSYVVDKANGLKSNYVTSIQIDCYGQIWAGTFGGGLVRLKKNIFHKTEGLTDAVYAIDIDANGNIFAGTERGLISIESSEITVHQTDDEFRKNVRSIRILTNGDLYYGTYNALIGPVKDKTKITECKNVFLHGNGASGMALFPDGSFYISTYGSGIWHVSKEFEVLNTFPQIPTKMINGLFQIGESAFGTSDAGLIQVQGNQLYSFTTEQGLPDNNPSVVYQDMDSSVWIGCATGVVRFEPESKRFKKVTHHFIGTRSLLFFRDTLNRFFLLTNKHLHIVTNEMLVPLKSVDIVPGIETNIYCAVFRNVNNSLYLGTSQGIFTIAMQEVSMQKLLPIPRMLSLKVDSLFIDIGEGKVVLEHDQNRLTVQVAMQSLFDKKYMKWAYFLEGIDTKWSEYIQNPELVIPSLPSGQYKLWAKTMNPDGLQSSEVLLLELEIKTPFWLTWYFIIIELIVVLLVVVSLSKYFARRKLKRRIKELEITQQVHEERQRIARDLHDNVGSQLTYLITNLDILSQTGVEKAQELSTFGRTAIGQLRETIWAIKSDYTTAEEFMERVHKFAEQYLADTGMNYNINNQIEKNILLSPSQTINLYRIVQEAVTNTVKHSGATNLEISVNIKNHFSLQIQDNGKGIVAEPKLGYGIENMKQRAKEIQAVFEMESEEGLGTVVRINCQTNG